MIWGRTATGCPRVRAFLLLWRNAGSLQDSLGKPVALSKREMDQILDKLLVHGMRPPEREKLQEIISNERHFLCGAPPRKTAGRHSMDPGAGPIKAAQRSRRIIELRQVKKKKVPPAPNQWA